MSDIDKKLWPAGPWHDEPDKDSFMYRDYFIELIRNFQGSWCGYVRIHKKDHPWYSKSYMDIDEVDVHGGLTFSDKNDDGDWIIGFDCSHFMDLVPLDTLSVMEIEMNQIPKEERIEMNELFNSLKKSYDHIKKLNARGRFKKSYCTYEYVKQECRNLVDQVIKAKE